MNAGTQPHMSYASPHNPYMISNTGDSCDERTISFRTFGTWLYKRGIERTKRTKLASKNGLTAVKNRQL